ncbi:MAG TPA: acetyl-CoA carboxylase, carboxyltransferase subunit beta [Thermomicrobiaceae bacterium]|nr:acetyl-CoA carboxylase, carboxyltransferase subunit beta [Thermomicrobiaceae bacterium]
MRDLFRRQPRFSAEPQSETGPAVPEDLWVKCPRCGELTYSREFERLHRVCPRCSHHGRLTAHERVDLLADAGSFTEWDADLETADPLNFVANDEAYRDRAVTARRKSGAHEALLTGAATIGGYPVALAVAEFGFLGASMGSVFGEKLARAVERAIDERRAVVTVSSSGGARMHESPFSLMQMAKTTAALARLAGAGLVHIAVLADPCYGGVTASYVTVADVIVAEPGAMIGFAGPRVIEQITRHKLPEGFQTAEFQLAHGMLDLIVPRRGLSGQLAILLGHYAAAAASTAATPAEVAGA